MADQFIIFLTNINVPLTFICNFMIFLGGFYVAIHSRIMPTWTVTCIWYLGLSGLLTSITILLDWVMGSDFPLSYTQIGIVPDMIQYIILSFSVWLLFANTVWSDIKGRRDRNKINKTEL